jgi:Asp-tRNA(Asn)/Glu-tRNA(Gln) amidotransferase A subunit family amidase
MPAALCGVVGFKPTAGRLSNAGVLPLNWTVGMPGILAGTVEDALMASVIRRHTPCFLSSSFLSPIATESE